MTNSKQTKKEFAERLHNLRISRGWTQSELARQAGLPRDSISTYFRAKSLPSPASLSALAKAFGVSPEELLPYNAPSANSTDGKPSFSMEMSNSNPGKAWVRMNGLVNFSTATKIAELLEKDTANPGTF